MYLKMQPTTQSSDERILALLERGPATPDEIAKKLGTAWATAQGHLLKLVATGKVVVIRKGRVNIYLLSSPPRPLPKTPRWARSRPLAELAKELAVYFDPKITAAEMIERERRRA